MSRTYKYPRESLGDSIERNESDIQQRIKKRIERRRLQRAKKSRKLHSFKKFIQFRDRQRARV